MDCGSCGRRLRNQDSIERGFGPVCWKKITGTVKKEKTDDALEDDNIQGQMDIFEFFGFMAE